MTAPINNEPIFTVTSSEGTIQKATVSYGGRTYNVSYDRKLSEQKIEDVKARIFAMVELYHSLPDKNISSITYNKQGETQIFYREGKSQNVQELHTHLDKTLNDPATTNNAEVNDHLQTQLATIKKYMNVAGNTILTSSNTNKPTGTNETSETPRWIPRSRTKLNPNENSLSISAVSAREFGNAASSHRVPKAETNRNVPKPEIPEIPDITIESTSPPRPSAPAPAKPIAPAQKQEIVLKATLKIKDDLLTTTNAGYENKAKELLNEANKLLSPKSNDGKSNVKKAFNKAVNTAKEILPLHKAAATNKIEKAFNERAEAAKNCDFDETHPLYDLTNLPSGTEGGKFVTGMDTAIVKQGSIHAMKKSYVNGTEKDVFTFNLSHHARDELQTTLDLIQKDPSVIPLLSARCPEIFGESFGKNGEITINYVRDGYDRANEEGQYMADPKTRLPIIASNIIPPGQDMASLNKLREQLKKPQDQASIENIQKKLDDALIIRAGQKNAIEITFGNIGKIRIGNDKDINALYNQVQVELNVDENSNNDNGVGLSKLHAMVSLLGVGPVVCKSRDQDEERLKIGLIFHTFFPREAFEMERKANFYSMSIEDLKKEICKTDPKRKELLEKYLGPESPLQKQQVYPGKEAYVFTDMAQNLRKQGAVGLMSGVGVEQPFPVVADIIVKMFEAGAAKSSKSRFQEGLFQEGASSDVDYSAGGSDSVFTRMVTENWKDSLIDPCLYHGPIQIFWKLEAANVAGTYASVSDTFGARGENEKIFTSVGGGCLNYYSKRPTLLELAEDLELAPSKDKTYLKKKWMSHAKGSPYLEPENGHNNEVMIKDQIPLTMAAGLGVSTENEKKILIQKLSAAGFICDKNKNKQTFDSVESIISDNLYIKIPGSDPEEIRLIDEFIHVTEHPEGADKKLRPVFKNEYWGSQQKV
jgi:hypothetical protein